MNFDMEKSILITCFDPFGGETENASMAAVFGLPERVGEYNIVKLCVPTVFDTAADTVLEKAREVNPAAIICVGQAAGRKEVTPEVIGINLIDARIPDNAGNMPKDTPVFKDAPAAYFSTLPVTRITEAVCQAGIPCKKSYSAGAFVCNCLLYSLLHRFDGSGTRVGFIHLPVLPQQAKENMPSMPAEDTVKALIAAINALD